MAVPTETGVFTNGVAPDMAASIRAAVGIVNEEEMSATLQVSVETLTTWRTKRKGPPHIKIGKKVFYSISEFGAWVVQESARQIETAKYKRAFPIAKATRQRSDFKSKPQPAFSGAPLVDGV